MIFVFLAGALGFLTFDAYRVYKLKIETGFIIVSFRSLLGVSVHVFVYIACGVIGVFINLDVIIDCCGLGFQSPMSDELLAPMMRAFAVGLAGPAGLSKGKASIDGDRSSESKGHRMEHLEKNEPGVLEYTRMLLMR